MENEHAKKIHINNFKVSNGVLLDEYQHNLDAAMNLPQASTLGKSYKCQ